ncbi:unnamed protein product [Brachionus calyciflorus]|uniref:Fibronectin type-III domain-containing protein n=1 Tax=Brachionus calyciflorus TaxID=104777 RepID=A0A813MA95_9BILA|nr:unnamed protein product [Brachionus calyciflorus]
MTKFLVLILCVSMTNAQFFQAQQSFSNICQSGIREDNTNYIYCARRGLTEIPLFSKNNVIYDELVLSDNKIKSLNSNSFSRIKVKKIYLNGNPLEQIESTTFNKLENNLEELWLDSIINTFQDYEINTSMLGLPRAISNLRNLNTLKLKGFHVKNLDSSILKRLNRIEVLSLQFCSIEKIEPNAFDGLKNNLKELYLDGNLLQQIPTEALSLISFKQLKILSLSQNSIKILNLNSFGFGPSSLLSKLDLSYNGLRQIDSQAFNTFNKTLESLLLQNNEINSFNLKFVQNLPELKDLNLDFNLLNRLDNFLFSKSSNLQSLSLQGNSLQFDEDSTFAFQGLSNLNKLNLARNGIKQLPNNLFKNLENLKNLIMDKNNLNECENLNEFTFDGVHSSLVNLSLQYNKLKTANLISLKKFTRLERIKLGYNDLDQLDMNIFENSFQTMTNLDVQNNKIGRLVFKDEILSNLIEMDLSNNKLCTFNSNLLKSPRLKSVSLSQNPLYCDCNLLPLYEWAKLKYDKDMFSYIQWQCEMENGDKIKMTSLSENDFKCGNSTPSKCLDVPKPQVNLDTLKMARISNINLKVLSNSVLVDWELTTEAIDNIRGFKLTFSKPNTSSDLSNFLIDKTKRNFKIDNLQFSTRYTICISIIRDQGYDKYCRDALIPDDEFAIKIPRATHQPVPLLQNQNSESFSYTNNSNLMISILVILVIFILILIVFLYMYVLKCRINEKNMKKNIYSGTLTANTLGSKRSPYQGALFTGENKKLELINNSQDAKCCCLISNPNTLVNNQRFIIHPGQYTLGDSSTVSSTLSSVNNPTETMSPNNLNEWKFKALNNVNNGDLASSTPTSFTHFVMPQNGVQNEQAYMAYDLYNCYQNPTSGTLIIPAVNSQKLGLVSVNTQNDHVYCEIPSTLSRTYRTLNHNGSNFINSHLNQINYNQIQNSHLLNNNNLQNTSTSLLLSSSTSSTSNSNSSSPHSANNNTKFTNASII